MEQKSLFDGLTPEVIINAVEDAVGKRLTGLTVPHASYINRVYELQAFDGERLIVKFYRPGRWSEAAVRQEHEFVLQCFEGEIPVVAPLNLASGDTLGRVGDILFAVFPKRAGREFEVREPGDWTRIGQIIGRIHAIGAAQDAVDRVRLHPADSTASDLQILAAGGFVSPVYRGEFVDLTGRLLEVAEQQFEGVSLIRIHGDCHRGNILERPGEGLMLIDFDDMAVGPAIHDLWLLLPDHYRRCRQEVDLILDGYEQFMEFDYAGLKLIEPLRFMRIIYFLAWCARQADDYDFKNHYPEWGSERFWEREIIDLRHQLQVVMEHKVSWEESRWDEDY